MGTKSDYSGNDFVCCLSALCLCVRLRVILAVFVFTLCLSEQADELKYFWMCASFILQGRINATSPKLTQLSTSSSDIYQIKYFRCSVTARDFPQNTIFLFLPHVYLCKYSSSDYLQVLCIEIRSHVH